MRRAELARAFPPAARRTIVIVPAHQLPTQCYAGFDKGLSTPPHRDRLNDRCGSRRSFAHRRAYLRAGGIRLREQKHSPTSRKHWTACRPERRLPPSDLEAIPQTHTLFRRHVAVCRAWPQARSTAQHESAQRVEIFSAPIRPSPCRHGDRIGIWPRSTYPRLESPHGHTISSNVGCERHHGASAVMRIPLMPPAMIAPNASADCLESSALATAHSIQPAPTLHVMPTNRLLASAVKF